MRGVLLLGILLSGVIGCAGSSGGGGDGRTYVMDVAAMSKDGCLNMQRTSEALKRFPEGTLVREFTVDLRLANEGSVREKYRPLILARNYQFDDVVYSESTIFNEFSSFQQADCATINQVNELDGSVEEFKVVEFTPTSITFERENLRYLVTLTSPQSMTVVKKYQVIDFCAERNDDFNMVGLESQRMIRWGAGGTVQTPTENVSNIMLKQVLQPLEAVPQGIQALGMQDVTEVNASAEELKQVAQAGARLDQQACPGVHPAPPPAEEGVADDENAGAGETAPVAPGATPAPAPADPNATPTPTPTPTPPAGGTL